MSELRHLSLKNAEREKRKEEKKRANAFDELCAELVHYVKKASPTQCKVQVRHYLVLTDEEKACLRTLFPAHDAHGTKAYTLYFWPKSFADYLVRALYQDGDDVRKVIIKWDPL